MSLLVVVTGLVVIVVVKLVEVLVGDWDVIAIEVPVKKMVV